MKNWKVVFALCCGLTVAACGDESAAQKAVRASLKDPDSGKFGAFTTIESSRQTDTTFACLSVNAKNSMGGYVGDRQAILVKRQGEWSVISIDDVDHESCVRSVTIRRA